MYKLSILSAKRRRRASTASAAPVPTSGPPTWPKAILFFCFFWWSGHPPLGGLPGARIVATGVASGGDLLAHTRLRREAGSRWDALAQAAG
jgi:hypothetical protein